MMTFIVCGDFILNAQLLDYRRLGKQRVEAIQILNAIYTHNKWSNHPIVRSWTPFITALKYYTNCIIQEWINRGGKNNIPLFEIPKLILMPWWCKWDRLHQSHRAMLNRKNPFYYNDKFTLDKEYLSYGYIWPTNVPYENQNFALSLIANPIPKELINPIYCNTIIKSGKNKGQPCNTIIKDNHTICKIHRKYNN